MNSFMDRLYDAAYRQGRYANISNGAQKAALQAYKNYQSGNFSGNIIGVDLLNNSISVYRWPRW
jgi:hypothetical protein